MQVTGNSPDMHVEPTRLTVPTYRLHRHPGESVCRYRRRHLLTVSVCRCVGGFQKTPTPGDLNSSRGVYKRKHPLFTNVYTCRLQMYTTETLQENTQ